MGDINLICTYLCSDCYEFGCDCCSIAEKNKETEEDKEKKEV